MSNHQQNDATNETPRVCLPQIGAEAPSFTATTTFGEKSLSDYHGSWLIFFAHPGDFNYRITCANIIPYKILFTFIKNVFNTHPSLLQ